MPLKSHQYLQSLTIASRGPKWDLDSHVCSSAIPLYIGIDAKQQRELIKLAVYFSAASACDEEYRPKNADSVGWELDGRSPPD